MNWKHLTLILALSLLLAGAVVAQPGTGAPGMGRGGPVWMNDDDDDDNRHLMFMQKGCMMGMNLSDDQQQKIEKLRLDHQKSMLEIRSEMHQFRTKMKLLITADKFDQKAVDELAGKIAKAHEKLTGMMAKHLRGVRDILTDEQKVKFDQKIISGKMGFQGQGPHPGMKGRPGMGERKHKRCQ